MQNFRKEIYNFLQSKGFKVSPHSRSILKKDIEIVNPKTQEKEIITVKYKLGKNNLQKFYGSIKKYSIPFKTLMIKNGKITKIKEE